MLNTSTCYYVYFHRRNDTKEIFYVGKGKSDRAFNTNKRTKLWQQICKSANGAHVEIFECNLTEDEAIHLEAEMIAKYSHQLVNLNNNSKVISLSKESLNELYYYDETSPTCLRWKVEAGGGCQKKNPGDIAGYLDGDKYGRVWASGKMLLIHRVIWTMFNGELSSKLHINHIDHNPNNNRISNLEAVTVRQNNNLKRKQDTYKIVKNKQGDAVSIQISYLNDNLTRCYKNFKTEDDIDKTIQLALEFKKEKLQNVVWDR